MWRYDGFSKLQLDLLNRHVVDLSGEVDSDMAKYVREAMLRLKAMDSPDIEIRVTSNGGHVLYGLDIYDMLRLYEGKTRGVVFGIAASMASVLLQACTERHAARGARILIHHVGKNQISLDDLRSTRKTARIRDEMEKLQSRLYAILSLRTGKSVRHVRMTCAKDKEMTAEQALAYGLVDKLV